MTDPPPTVLRDRSDRAKGQASMYREKAMADYDGRCERCGEETPVSVAQVHHQDRDRMNDNRDNLLVVCVDCHREEHYGDDPLYGVTVSLPWSLLCLLDLVVESNEYSSRSEAVARALVDHHDGDFGLLADPRDAAEAWFGDDQHTKYVTEKAYRRG